MKIQTIPNYSSFTSSNKSFLDRIHENTRNSADMTDTIVVPRTIFKGYLGIMAGTTLVTLAGITKQNSRNFSKGQWRPDFFPPCTERGLL